MGRLQWQVAMELSGIAGAVQVSEVHAGGGAVTDCAAATLGLLWLRPSWSLLASSTALRWPKPRRIAKPGGAVHDAGHDDR
jgi:hypothetical protein